MTTMSFTGSGNDTAKTAPKSAGVVTGVPRLLLQVEGAALALFAGYTYNLTGGAWWLFALLFLVPDVFMLGYLVSPRLGAAIYNFGHSTVPPILLAALGWVVAVPLVTSIGLIWLAHVGFDRAVGYGFKYGDHFKHTHLGTPFAK